MFFSYKQKNAIYGHAIIRRYTILSRWEIDLETLWIIKNRSDMNFTHLETCFVVVHCDLMALYFKQHSRCLRALADIKARTCQSRVVVIVGVLYQLQNEMCVFAVKQAKIELDFKSDGMHRPKMHPYTQE